VRPVVGDRGRAGKRLIFDPDRRYRFVLAERLGMTVGELGRRMSSREMSEWMFYDRVLANEAEVRKG
jgi:hypothetical protein